MSQGVQGCEQEIGKMFTNVIRLRSEGKHHFHPTMTAITNYLINYFDNHEHAVKVPPIESNIKVPPIESNIEVRMM